MLVSNSFINKHVYFAKSQFLFISKMLKIKVWNLVKLYEIVWEIQLWAFAIIMKIIMFHAN